MSDTAWPEVTLGDHVDLLSGFAFKSKQFTDEPDDIPLVKGANVHQGFIDWETAKRWPTTELNGCEKYFLEADDVVLAMDRPWIEAGLKWAWIRPEHPKSLLVQRVSRMRGLDNLDTRFLRYIVGSPQFTDYIRPIVTGVNVPHISGGQIKGFKFLLPALPTQRKIASILSAYDDLIENNTRRIAVLEEMAQSIYREWFVNFRFPGFEDVKLVDSPLGMIPEGWEAYDLYSSADVTQGFAFKSKLFNDEGNGIPVIRIRNIPKHKSKTFTTQEAADKYLVENGDILIGMDGDFHMCRWSGGTSFLNQRVTRIRGTTCLPEYVLFHALKMPIEYLNATIVGTTVAHLGKSHLEKLHVTMPYPELCEQAHEVFDPLYELEIVLRRKNEVLRTTRDLLLPKLISGKLDVEDLDIDVSEPLEKLQETTA